MAAAQAAAAQNTMAAMYTRLGFSAGATNIIRTDEQLDDLSSVRDLVDSRLDRSRITNIVKTIHRRPDGCRTLTVSERAENGLFVAAFIGYHWYRAGHYNRIPDHIVTDTSLFEEAQRQINLEKTHVNSEHALKPLTPAILKKSYANVFDMFAEQLEHIRGCQNVPMAYLCRDNLIAPDSAGDDHSNYATWDLELIARITIILPANRNDPDLEKMSPDTLTPWARHDNMLLWDILKKFFEPTNVFVHAKTAQRTRNGRVGLFSIKRSMYGNQMLDSRNEGARAELAKLVYYGDTRNWKYADFIAKHKEIHATIESLVPHAYNDLTGREKVTSLLNGMQATPAAHIPALVETNNDGLLEDFERVQVLCGDTMRTHYDRQKRQAPKAGNRAISAVNANPNQDGGKAGTVPGFKARPNVAVCEENATKYCKDITETY